LEVLTRKIFHTKLYEKRKICDQIKNPPFSPPLKKLKEKQVGWVKKEQDYNAQMGQGQT